MSNYISWMGVDRSAFHFNIKNEYAQLEEYSGDPANTFIVIEDPTDGGKKKKATLSEIHDEKAVHVDIANEFAVIPIKATIESGDAFIIEDGDDNNQKKKVYFTSLGDPYAIHRNVAHEFTEGIPPASSLDDYDKLLLEAHDDGHKEYLNWKDLRDFDALHYNISGEFDPIPLKPLPEVTDKLLIETSSGEKRKIYFTDSTDAQAIHRLVANEFSGIPIKPTPDVTDKILIEDNTGAKKVTFFTSNIDINAVHTNTADEFSKVAYKETPVLSDRFLLEDSEDSFNKKYTSYVSTFDATAVHVDRTHEFDGVPLKTPAPTDKILVEDHLGTKWVINFTSNTDTHAYHDDVSGEIEATPFKSSPVSTDLVVIEDSEDGFVKKSAYFSSGITDPQAIHKNVPNEFGVMPHKPLPTSQDRIVIEDFYDNYNKKWTIIFDQDAFHFNGSNEFSRLDELTTLSEHDRFLVEDESDYFNNKFIKASNLEDFQAVHTTQRYEISPLPIADPDNFSGNKWMIVEDDRDGTKTRIDIFSLRNLGEHQTSDGHKIFIGNIDNKLWFKNLMVHPDHPVSWNATDQHLWLDWDTSKINIDALDDTSTHCIVTTIERAAWDATSAATAANTAAIVDLNVWRAEVDAHLTALDASVAEIEADVAGLDTEVGELNYEVEELQDLAHEQGTDTTLGVMTADIDMGGHSITNLKDNRTWAELINGLHNSEHITVTDMVDTLMDNGFKNIGAVLLGHVDVLKGINNSTAEFRRIYSDSNIVPISLSGADNNEIHFNIVQENIHHLGVQDQSLDMGTHKITNLMAPTGALDAANKAYVDLLGGVGSIENVGNGTGIWKETNPVTHRASFYSLSENDDGTIYFYLDVGANVITANLRPDNIHSLGWQNADLDMGNPQTQTLHKIIHVADPTIGTDAANKDYVDNKGGIDDGDNTDDDHAAVFKERLGPDLVFRTLMPEDETVMSITHDEVNVEFELFYNGIWTKIINYYDTLANNNALPCGELIIRNISDPENDQDAASKFYVDSNRRLAENYRVIDNLSTDTASVALYRGVNPLNNYLSFSQLIFENLHDIHHNNPLFVKTDSVELHHTYSLYIDKTKLDEIGVQKADIDMGSHHLKTLPTYGILADSPNESCAVSLQTLYNIFALMATSAENIISEVSYYEDTNLPLVKFFTPTADTVPDNILAINQFQDKLIFSVWLTSIVKVGKQVQDLDMGYHYINNVNDPHFSQQVATKHYVDALSGLVQPGYNIDVQHEWIYCAGFFKEVSGISPYALSFKKLYSNHQTIKIVDYDDGVSIELIPSYIDHLGNLKADLIFSSTQYRIKNVGDPVDPQDVVTKQYFHDNGWPGFVLRPYGGWDLGVTYFPLFVGGDVFSHGKFCSNALLLPPTINNKTNFLTIQYNPPGEQTEEFRNGILLGLTPDKITEIGAQLSDMNLNNHKITMIKDPTNAQDAVNKQYYYDNLPSATNMGGPATGDLQDYYKPYFAKDEVENKYIFASLYINRTNTPYYIRKTTYVGQGAQQLYWDYTKVTRIGTQIQDMNLGAKKITNLGAPVNDNDAINKQYYYDNLPGAINSITACDGEHTTQYLPYYGYNLGENRYTFSGLQIDDNSPFYYQRPQDLSASYFLRWDYTKVTKVGTQIQNLQMGDGQNNYQIKNLADPTEATDAATRQYVLNHTWPNAIQRPAVTPYTTVSIYRTPDIYSDGQIIFNRIIAPAISENETNFLDIAYQPEDGQSTATKNGVLIRVIPSSITSIGVQIENLQMNNNKIEGVSDPENDLDAANKQFVDQEVHGLNFNGYDEIHDNIPNIVFSTILHGVDFDAQNNEWNYAFYPIGVDENSGLQWINTASKNQYLQIDTTKIKNLGVQTTHFQMGDGIENYQIKNLGTPLDDLDAATKKYVDEKFEELSSIVMAKLNDIETQVGLLN